jgi:hypothetical protein
MFLTTQCSSSGGMYKQLYAILRCIYEYITSIVADGICLIINRIELNEVRGDFRNTAYLTLAVYVPADAQWLVQSCAA